MIKAFFYLLIIAGIFILVVRVGISSSGFLNDGVMESLQACNNDDDCIWVDTGCCSCIQGGGELLINKEKEWIYPLLKKPLCLEEQSCFGENACHEGEVYCDRTCKFGEKHYDKPLLLR